MAESKVTSVGLKGPDGFDIINSPITSRGNLEFAFSRGFTLPSISRQTSWDRAYADSHRHINKIILDEITEEHIDNWDIALEHTHIQGNPHNLAFKDILKMPNTLGGYGIIDAYTKSEINHIINSIPPSNGGNDITILTSDSWANETDSNIYSALRTRKELDNLRELINSSGGSLNHTHPNKAIIDSFTQKHLDILALFSIDEGNLKVGTSLFSIGEISAYGLGEGSGGGGGGTTVSWGTELSGGIGLTVDGITKTLALKSGLDLKQDKLIAGSGITIIGNTISSTVTGGGITSIGLTAPTGFSVSNSPITSNGNLALSFATGYSLPTTAKQGQWDTAYSERHTHSNKTVLDGITSTLITNWNDANTKKHTHANKSVLDGITSGKISNWDTASTNTHTHPNKTIIDQLTQDNINVLKKMSMDGLNIKVNTNLYSTGEVSAYGLGSGSGGGGGGSLVSWGTESNSFIPLTVEGISKTVALLGHTHTKSQVGLGNVDNTSDLLKPISTATQTALNSKFNVPTGTTSQYIRGDGSLATYTDTTYSLMSLAELNTGTATTNRVVNSKNLNDWLSGKGYALSNHTHTFASLISKPTTIAGYGITNGALTTTSIIAGKGLSGGGTLASDRTITLGTPSTLSNSTTNSVTASSHTHAIDTSMTGEMLKIVSTNAQGAVTSSSFNTDTVIEKKLDKAGWYRCATSYSSGALGASFIIMIHRTYNVANNESYVFSISTAHNGEHSITQLSGIANISIIPKIRVVQVNSGSLTVDLYYNSSASNVVRISVIGTAYANLDLPEVIAPVGNVTEFDTANGIKTNQAFNTTNWKWEQVGSELQLKYNNVVAQRFLLDGSIVGLGEITAYGATTGGEGVSLLRTGGTMTGNLTMSADIIMNSGKSIGVSNLPLKLLGNALTYNASNILTETNTANQIKMGNGWTIEQTTTSLTIRKNGVVKGTFNA